MYSMMNNSWYTVRPKFLHDEENRAITIYFRHPCEPGTGKGGWMQPSTENQIEKIKHEVASPQKSLREKRLKSTIRQMTAGLLSMARFMMLRAYLIGILVARYR